MDYDNCGIKGKQWYLSKHRNNDNWIIAGVPIMRKPHFLIDLKLLLVI
jgi:hypothetical protein